MFIFLFLFIFTLGIALNYFALYMNNGKMPVYTNFPLNDYKLHFNFNDFAEVNVPYFTDIIQFPLYGNSFYSIGDFLFYIGFSGILIHAIIFVLEMRYYSERHKKEKKKK